MQISTLFTATVSVLLAETLLSLYPILIKTVNTSLFTQVIARIVTTAIVSYFFITMPIGDVINTPSYYVISLLYLIHIYVSYVGFQNLGVGVALTIFYIYPLINVLIKDLFITKTIDKEVIYNFIISIIGVFLIAQGSDSPDTIQPVGVDNGQPLISNKLMGIIAIVFAAITESLIYTFYKVESGGNPFNMLFTLTFFGAVIMSIAWWAGVAPLVDDPNNPPFNFGGFTLSPTIIKLIVANIIMGVSGYALRFYSIHKISTEWYSILAFFEVIIGYIFGWYILGEKITKWHLAGTSLILYSVYQINKIGY